MPFYARKHQLNNYLIYHIINRGNRRDVVFSCKADYLYFMQLLKDYTLRFNLKIYHWVLMPNHYHILLEITEPELISRCMAGINRSYTCYYHRTYLTAGFLWQGRFKLQPVQKEDYLLACGRYIERNSVRAHLTLEASDYPYSSARFYCLGIEDGLTVEDPLFITFGSEATSRRLAYREFLCNFDTEEESSLRNLEEPLGNKEFVRRLIREHGRFIPKRRGRPTERIVV